jgi:hypothetical protein
MQESSPSYLKRIGLKLILPRDIVKFAGHGIINSEDVGGRRRMPAFLRGQ